MDQKLNGGNPLSYRGVNAYSPPDFVTHPRPPTTKDWRNFIIGTIWLDSNNSPPDNQDIYMLVSVAMSGTPPLHVATWVALGTNVGPQTITGDAGGPISPDGLNNINLFSSVNALEFNGFPGVNTISLDTVSGNNLLETLSDDSDTIVTADAAANIKLEGTPGHITVTSDPGANKLVFDYVGTNTDSFTTDAGIAIPVLGNLNVLGDGVAITTAGAGDTITISSSSANQYTTDDTNIAVPAAGNINIFGATGISTSSAGSTVTVGAKGANFCSFSVGLNGNASDVTGDGTWVSIPFDFAFFNIGSNYNLATHLFVAPIDGVYLFTATVTLSDLGAVGNASRMDTGIRTSAPAQFIQSNTWIASDGDAAFGGTGAHQETNTWIVYLTSGTTVEYNVNSTFYAAPVKTVDIVGNGAADPRTVFSGTLLA